MVTDSRFDFSDEEPTFNEHYSDGVPEPIGDGGDSEKLMPVPPRSSEPINELEKTLPVRKVQR